MYKFCVCEFVCVNVEFVEVIVMTCKFSLEMFAFVVGVVDRARCFLFLDVVDLVVVYVY